MIVIPLAATWLTQVRQRARTGLSSYLRQPGGEINRQAYCRITGDKQDKRHPALA
jgi:hypothetical protein